jgi:hypothetical protein
VEEHYMGCYILKRNFLLCVLFDCLYYIRKDQNMTKVCNSLFWTAITICYISVTPSESKAVGSLWNMITHVAFGPWYLILKTEINPLLSLALQSAWDLNVLCWPKRSKALLLSYTFKCPLKNTQSFFPCSRALNRSGKGLMFSSFSCLSDGTGILGSYSLNSVHCTVYTGLEAVRISVYWYKIVLCL